MKQERKNEIGMIFVLLLISAAVFVWISFLKKPGAKVIITVEGSLYDELYLNDNTDLKIENGKGGVNHLVIAEGFAFMSEANCSDLLCVHQKKISLSGETLVCLPNKVVVEVKQEEGKQEENFLDGIAD